MPSFHHSLANARLYAILDTSYVREASLSDTARAIIDGGADIVQLRAKQLHPDRIRALAIVLLPLFADAGIPFIINDHPAIAAAASCAGTHVGQDDMAIVDAREKSGPHAIVGKSTHSIEQAKAALAERPDYIAYGPLYANQTKPDYAPVGLSDVADIHAISNVPVFCIGGIKEHNLDAVIAAGARRVVIVSELLISPDLPAYCARIKDRLPSLPVLG